MNAIKLNIGIVRNVDGLGRVVLPIELRRTMGIAIRDPLEIYVDDDSIILKKYAPGCMFCGIAKDLNYFCNKRMCKECRNSIINSFNLEN